MWCRWLYLQSYKKLSHYRPRGFQDVKAPRFLDNRHKKVAGIYIHIEKSNYSLGHIFIYFQCWQSQNIVLCLTYCDAFTMWWCHNHWEWDVLYTGTCTTLQINRSCIWPTTQSLSFDDLLRRLKLRERLEGIVLVCLTKIVYRKHINVAVYICGYTHCDKLRLQGKCMYA
jgi:hypothetical protein